MQRMTHALVTMLVAGCAAVVGAQKTTDVHPGAAGSPHVRTTWTIDGATIAVEYGRPYLKGRAESQMMPPGRPWRTGADEATVLTSDKPLKFGSVTLPAGSHTINTQPGEPWQLILGKLGAPKQWGVPYNASLEIGRAPMTAGKTAAPVEQVTISIDDTATGAVLRIEWGTTRASIPFTVG